MDDEAGRAAGHPTAIGMGNLQWAYLHNLLRGWLGGRGRIVRVEGWAEVPPRKHSERSSHD